MRSLTSEDVRKIVEPYVTQGAAQGLDHQGYGLARQSDRQVLHRRPGRRLRPHRPQDHRRHLWRCGTAWRRRLLGQGPDQGRPLGGLCGALSRQERRSRPASPSAARSSFPMRSACRSRCRSMSIRMAPARSRRSKLEKALGEVMDLTPRGIRKHLGLNKPIYARTSSYGHFGRAPRQGRRLLVGEDRSRQGAQSRGEVTDAAPRHQLYGRRKGHALRPHHSELIAETAAALYASILATRYERDQAPGLA